MSFEGIYVLQKQPAKPKDEPTLKTIRLAPFNDKESASSNVDVLNVDAVPAFQKEVINLLVTILQKQNDIEERLSDLEETIRNAATERREFKAQSKKLKECETKLKDVMYSAYNSKADVKIELRTEIANIFPLNSFDASNELEDRLRDEEFAEAMKKYLLSLRGADTKVDPLVKHCITDDFLHLFNWDGRRGKEALEQYTLFKVIFYEIFKSEGRTWFEKSMRKSIDLSHSRVIQKKYLSKKEKLSK